MELQAHCGQPWRVKEVKQYLSFSAAAMVHRRPGLMGSSRECCAQMHLHGETFILSSGTS